MTICAGLAAALLLSAATAIACPPPPPDVRTADQVAADARRRYEAAVDLVQVRVTATATDRRTGRAIVLQSRKARVLPGASLRLSTMAEVSCGYGTALRGSTHWLYLSAPDRAFFAPLEADTRLSLARLGVLTAD